MPEAIKIRAQTQGEWTEIRFLMPHPMETGIKRDENGGYQIAPSEAHFITSFTLTHNGKVLVHGHTNTSIAPNPLFAFRALGIRSGDKIRVAWQDNRGETRSDEICVP